MARSRRRSCQPLATTSSRKTNVLSRRLSPSTSTCGVPTPRLARGAQPCFPTSDSLTLAHRLAGRGGTESTGWTLPAANISSGRSSHSPLLPAQVLLSRWVRPVSGAAPQHRFAYVQMSDEQSPPGNRTSCALAGPSGSAPKFTWKPSFNSIPPLTVSQSSCSIDEPCSARPG
jgi:hypothetical protein